MDRSTRVVVASTLVLLVTLGAGALAQEKKPGVPPMSAAEQAMMAQWQAYMTPGEAHKHLQAKVGTWDMLVKSASGPGAPAEESKATSEAKLIFDGRYLQDSTAGSFGGMPFLGSGLTGFDNLKKKYVSTWIDNMSTGIMVAEGTYDAASKTFHYTGTMSDPRIGGEKQVRSVERIVSPDAWVMEMYEPGPDGKEWKSMEITYTRKE